MGCAAEVRACRQQALRGGPQRHLRSLAGNAAMLRSAGARQEAPRACARRRLVVGLAAHVAGHRLGDQHLGCRS
eukprot:13998898-Alexandrium_andersonii.AAC.1